VISISQHYSGQVMRVADFAMAGLADRPPRYLVHRRRRHRPDETPRW
jgi:hypothetical protein